MNISRAALNHPYAVAAAVLLVAAMGFIGFLRTPSELFPDTFPPQVVVVTVQPGASADDVSDKITEVIEKEINTLSGLESIRSTSRDQVSAVMAEFSYSKDPGQAILDVQNAMARIRADLPVNAQEPKLYRLSDATARPLLTLALRPKNDSRRDLSEIRLLAENQIQDRLLAIEGVADVDVFGGHRPEIRVRVDRDELAANGVSIGEVIAALAEQNISAPAGNIYAGDSEYLVRIAGEFKNLSEIRQLPIRRPGRGLLRISDVAEVELTEQEPRSAYHGNGKAAIALGVIKPEGGNTVAAIERVKSFLPELGALYPDIAFELTQDQQPLIDINMHGMVLSIIEAVIFTVAVIFLFLAEARAALVAGITIPLSFLFTLAVLWFTPYTLNMVTLSGLIVATGMVVDASVVALENIYRHFHAGKGPDGTEGQPDAKTAADTGAREIALAITAGMLTTVAVLVPIIFIGGYPGRTIGRLSLTISITMVASLVLALTLVPLLASKVLGRKREKKNIAERVASRVDVGVGFIRRFYVFILKGALRWRLVTLILAAAFFVVTVRTIPPIIGGALMPPMDTGIAIVEFDLPATDGIGQMEKTLNRVEEIIYAQPGIEKVSSVIGSEPGAISFGTGGATTQSASITVELVDRTQREKSIWAIEETWREKLRQVPGIKSFRVSEYGATPMATTKAPVDIIISGPDARILDRLADQTMQRLQGVRGLTDVRRSWHFDQKQVDVTVDPALARMYGTSPEEVSRQVSAAVQGVPATSMRLADFLDIPIRVQYGRSDRNSLSALEHAYVGSDFGPIPLRAMAEVETQTQRPFITREDLQATIDVTGVNFDMTIAQVTGMAKKALAGLDPPGGYNIEFAGTASDMKSTQKQLRQALIIGIVLLYFLLLAMFGSFAHPITIMAAIPLAVAGSMWGLLLFDKPMCMPGTMGMIFLAGIIINNSVLLLDFIIQARKQGSEKNDAIVRAVELRIRPILMTTFSTIIGLSPLIFETAVGLERLSPLGIVAGSGLLVGTFLTMIVVPVVYSGMDSVGHGLSGLLRGHRAGLKGA
ncbi:MAG: efflux RND transporter permease subunit [Desulfobacterales bacterium]|nr:efflux RND transporter permease subunit [Desulfobacterales bacterium]